MKTINLIHKNKFFAKAKVYDGFFLKSKGLMFSRKLKQKEAILIILNSNKEILHMFFVFQKINIIGLDENKKVVLKKENLIPFLSFLRLNNIKYIIETREDINSIRLNDQIEFLNFD